VRRRRFGFLTGFPRGADFCSLCRVPDPRIQTRSELESRFPLSDSSHYMALSVFLSTHVLGECNPRNCPPPIPQYNRSFWSFRSAEYSSSIGHGHNANRPRRHVSPFLMQVSSCIKATDRGLNRLFLVFRPCAVKKVFLYLS